MRGEIDAAVATLWKANEAFGGTASSSAASSSSPPQTDDVAGAGVSAGKEEKEEKEAVAPGADLAAIMVDLAKMLKLSGRTKEAEEVWEAGLSKSPSSFPSFFVEMGQQQAANGDDEAAEQWFRSGMAQCPAETCGPTALALGDLLLRQNREDEAVESFRYVVCPYVCVSVCLFLSVCFCLSVCLSACLPACLSVRLQLLRSAFFNN
jgi:TolA-binding protein